ncbi:MAG: hypothetical protein JST39_04290 [Bacteroidetes bacterium]|nr:hypothetical protein [Bacteroidota bacterium]
MKHLLLAIILCGSVAAVSAQSEKYTAAMKKAITQMDSAKTVDDLQSAAGAFERIGDAEKTQWLPYYYAALCQSFVGWRPEVKDKDANAEKTKAYLAKAEAIETNAELMAVENMTATQQMLVDPQSRWQTYGQQGAAALQKGLKLDPNNPRLYYLQGMGIFGTPTQFGGGKDKAKPILEKALALYKSAQPKPLYPTWGQKQTEDAIAQCQ